MKHINESIIGRKGSAKSPKIPGNIYPEQDLDYGDVVMYFNTYYIYLPTIQHLHWWRDKDGLKHFSGMFVRYNSSKLPPRANYIVGGVVSENYFEYVTTVREYKNIKTPEDLKHIFDKYNIPYK